MSFTEICNKEVVQIESGVCLGKIDDLILNPATAEIESFVMFGRTKLFGLMGREESFVIQWHEVLKFGVDAILIETPLPAGAPRAKKNFWEIFRAQKT